MLQVDIITLFPDYFRGILGSSIPARASEAGLVRYRVVHLRDFAVDRHGTVDDYPYGGGAGMVLRPEPVFEAVEWCRAGAEQAQEKSRTVLLSARGKLLRQKLCESYSLLGHLVIICGHYKDVDNRVAEFLADDEVSVGDYVLSGGEPAAAVLLDSVVRLLPGALGDFDSAMEDSHSEGLLGAPQYTRPRSYRGHEVPGVLTSGDHEAIRRWREQQSETLTRQRRPDMPGGSN